MNTKSKTKSDRASKKLKVAIFIPAYQHVKCLPPTIDRIPDEIKDMVEEIFVIDDASSDNTYLLAKGYKHDRGLKKLSVYKNEKNRGYGGNQKRGYSYAIKKGYDVVVMLHGDGQYAPEVLPKLLQPFFQGRADMVFGSRIQKISSLATAQTHSTEATAKALTHFSITVPLTQMPPSATSSNF